MSRKPPLSEQIQAMLREGHFGQSRDLPPADPIATTQMMLEIDRIKPYDHNPRRERNPQYDEIKESIRAQGELNNPLTVTRRPGEELFMVESGGNTRLQILHELWRDTHDERFHRIHCLFRPWVSESHVLTAHLIENDKRGALAFIDKALGVRELREVLELEHQQKFSQRRLAEALKECGYGLDQSMISRMDYAVDVLLPLIPEALRAGMGAPQIRRLRRLEQACQRLWTDCGQPPDAFGALFGEALAELDVPGWDMEAAQQEIENRLAEILNLSLKHVRLELDARLAIDRDERNQPVVENVVAPKAEESPVGPSPMTTALHHHTTGIPIDITETASADIASAIAPASDHLASSGSQQQLMSASSPIDTPPTALESASCYTGPGDLKSLRSRGYVLALKIAKRHDLEDCIMPATSLGMGFLLDVPRDPIMPTPAAADALSLLYRQWVWWLLLSLSEEAVHPNRMEQAPRDLLLRRMILEGNDNRALALVGEPDWKAVGYELINNPSTPEQTLDDLAVLAQTCRQIRRLAGDDGGTRLWRRDG